MAFWCTGLSEEGLLVLKREPIENLFTVKLAVELNSSTTIETDAVVIQEFPGVGFKVRFTTLKAEDRMKIARTVQATLKELAASALFPQPSEQIMEKGDKRSEFRVTVSFDVQLESASSIQRGKVYDVSYSGATVWSTRSFEVGEQVLLTGLSKKFRLPAIVRNSQPKDRYWRIGLQFTQPPKDWVIAP